MDGHMDMRLTASATKLTYHDFVSFPDDGRRHELIDGEHYVTPSPITRHQRVLGRLFAALFQYCDANPIGEVFQARFDVVFSMFDVVEPDLLVVMADQADIVTDKHVRGAPALVVEVLSPGTRRHDEGIKRKLYDRARCLSSRRAQITDRTGRRSPALAPPRPAGPRAPGSTTPD